MEQGTATDDIAAGDPPSDLASSVPALSLPTPDGPALSDPTPDGSPPSPDDNFLPPPGWLESPDPSLQIVAASASPISVVAASESSSDVVVPATLQSQPDPVFSAPLSSPARLQCDIDPVSALVHFCSTPSPVPSLCISPAPTLDATASPASQESVVAETVERLSAVAQQKGLAFDASTLSQFVQDTSVRIQTSGVTLHVHDSTWSWNQHYSVLSFLLNGHLHAEYTKLSGWLGLPPCGKSLWQRIIERLEPHVTELAEWSCKTVRERIEKRGDKDKWVASFDGFYLTRGHYSNNYSATIHDYHEGGIAWFCHRTKKGAGHNWAGTSSGAESDMLEEVLGKVKKSDFVVQELVTDKDSTTNAIFCKHFPEGTVTYCSNHCTKNLHKHLEKLKKNKCEVCQTIFVSITYISKLVQFSVSSQQLPL